MELPFVESQAGVPRLARPTLGLAGALMFLLVDLLPGERLQFPERLVGESFASRRASCAWPCSYPRKRPPTAPNDSPTNPFRELQTFAWQKVYERTSALLPTQGRPRQPWDAA